MNGLRIILLIPMLWFLVNDPLNAQLLEGFDTFSWEQKDSMISSVYGSGAFVLTKLMIDKAYEAAIEKENPNLQEMARVNMWMGLQNLAEQKVDTAEQFLLKSKEIYEANPAIQDSSFQDVLINLADIKLLSSVEEACDYYQQAESYMEQKGLDSSGLYLNTINQIIACLIETGRHDDAETYGRKSINTAKQLYGDKSNPYLQSLTLLGNIYGAKGEARRAANLILQAGVLAESYLEEDDVNRLTYWSNAADYYLRDGQLEKVEETYNKMLDFYNDNSELKEYDSYPTLLDNFGRLYQQKGDLEKSYEHYHRANILFTLRREKTDPTYIISQMNVGNILRDQEKYTEAEQYYLDALQQAPAAFGEDSWTVAFLNQNLAEVYQGTQEWGKAIERENSAFEIIEKALGPDHEEYARTLLRLSQFYQNQGDQDQYRDYLILAHDKYEKLFGVEHATVFKLNQDLIQFFKDDDQNAGAYFLDACKYIDHYAGEILKYLPVQDRLDRENDYFDFLQGYASWIEDNQPSKDHLIQLEISIWKLVKHSNRPSFISLAKYQNERSETLMKNYPEWQRLGKQIFDYQSLSLKEKEKYPIETWRKKSAQFEKAMAQGLHNDSEVLPILRKQLTSDQIFLYITSLPGSDPESDKPLLFINQALNQISLISLPKEFGPNEIWEKVKPFLSGIKKVYILTEGNYRRVAMANVASGPKKYVHNDYELVFITSESSSASTNDFSGKTGLLAFDLYNEIGGGAGSMDIEGAPFFLNLKRTEIIPDSIKTHAVFSNQSVHTADIPGIEKFLGKKGWTLAKLSGSSAVEPEFGRRIHSENPNLIHCTANGFYVDKNFANLSYEPFLFSGLTLSGGKTTWQNNTETPMNADGLLFAYEITLMDLSSVDLFVLSSLSTDGNFDVGDNFNDLLKSLKMAGVKNILTTVSAVSDKDSSTFMNLFYKNISKGQSIRDAFQNTKIKLQKKLDPEVWGSYLLIQ